MSIKIVAYSLKTVYGSQVLSMDMSSRITEVEYNSHIMIDVPVIGVKRFVWFPYIIGSHIFDNGHCYFMLCDYKKVDRKYALQYLINYERNGRKNCKNYSLKKLIKTDYKTLLNQ